MLIHIEPRMYVGGFPGDVELLDLECAELGLHLRAGVDLMVGRPYRNQGYRIVCRKFGRKAVHGILIDTKAQVKEINVVMRWELSQGQDSIVTTHRVNYQIPDHTSEVVSENTELWSRDAWERLQALCPLADGGKAQQPLMNVFAHHQRSADRCDVTFSHGVGILERSEHFYMAPVSYQAMRDHYSGRMPELSAAFQAEPVSTVIVPPGSTAHLPMVLDLELGNRCPSLSEVMDRLNLTLIQHPDGSAQLAGDFVLTPDEPVDYYSPRLSELALDHFCEDNMGRYLSFYEEHRERLDKLELVPMAHFWRGGQAQKAAYQCERSSLAVNEGRD